MSRQTANRIGEDLCHEVFLVSVAWGVIALLSGPFTVTFVWLLAATAAETGFLILPDSAPRFSGPKGREADITEILATREQTGGSIGLFRQPSHLRAGRPRTSTKPRMNSSTSSRASLR